VTAALGFKFTAVAVIVTMFLFSAMVSAAAGIILLSAAPVVAKCFLKIPHIALFCLRQQLIVYSMKKKNFMAQTHSAHEHIVTVSVKVQVASM